MASVNNCKCSFDPHEFDHFKNCSSTRQHEEPPGVTGPRDTQQLCSQRRRMCGSKVKTWGYWGPLLHPTASYHSVSSRGSWTCNCPQSFVTTCLSFCIFNNSMESSSFLSPESTVTSLLSSSGHLRSCLEVPEHNSTFRYKYKVKLSSLNTATINVKMFTSFWIPQCFKKTTIHLSEATHTWRTCTDMLFTYIQLRNLLTDKVLTVSLFCGLCLMVAALWLSFCSVERLHCRL